MKKIPMLSHWDLLAPPARLELTTLRLGGVRSILVSYGGIFKILYRKKSGLSTVIPHIFGPRPHIIPHMLPGREGGKPMRESDDPNADLEDLIFDEESGGPSQR